MGESHISTQNLRSQKWCYFFDNFKRLMWKSWFLDHGNMTQKSYNHTINRKKEVSKVSLGTLAAGEHVIRLLVGIPQSVYWRNYKKTIPTLIHFKDHNLLVSYKPSYSDSALLENKYEQNPRVVVIRLLFHSKISMNISWNINWNTQALHWKIPQQHK